MARSPGAHLQRVPRWLSARVIAMVIDLAGIHLLPVHFCIADLSSQVAQSLLHIVFIVRVKRLLV